MNPRRGRRRHRAPSGRHPPRPPRGKCRRGTEACVPLFLGWKRQRPRHAGAPQGKGSAMYSIFYIIGVIVVILAVLQLIA